MHQRRQVLVYPGEDGFWVIEYPSLPGCISQGKTKEEALENIREAIDLYVESLREDGLPIPEVRQIRETVGEMMDTRIRQSEEKFAERLHDTETRLLKAFLSIPAFGRTHAQNVGPHLQHGHCERPAAQQSGAPRD